MSTTINAAPAAPAAASSEMSRPSVLRRIMRDRVAGAAAIILTVVVVAALFAQWIAPYAPYALHLPHVMAPPGRAHTPVRWALAPREPSPCLAYLRGSNSHCGRLARK